ncbi:LacI family transcriptional regulator [Halanaerobium saccharolyticum]|uniref:LacI family transcriptional regulator n=1 Tax=Halanaerobium saccharolyticum TaxID=43595 RepID=A0A4R6M121_9FIRM|nr:substrate-binding domain-containing protein [Halanaerobium saccharolyticum]TDO94040.1 LacI family transcriptional regulator [Halanaerobium saccharolyticum]
MEMKNITISDIAEALNLSRSTIDRVINNRGSVAKETQKKVLDYIEKNDYKPNRAAKHLAKMTNCTIGISYYLPEKFAAQIKTGIEDVYQELKGYGLNLIIKEASSFAEQIDQIKEMKSKVDGLMVAPWSPKKTNSLINKFIEDKIPVVTFNRDAPESNRLFYFGCDYFKAGRISGELIKKITLTAGKIAIISNDDDLVGKSRVQGFYSILKENTFHQIIGPFTVYDHFGISDAYTQKDVNYIKKIIEDNPDLKAFYVVNQSLYLVARVVKEMGKKDQIKVIGFDLFDNFIPFLEEEVIDAVICQEPYSQGYFPVKILFEILVEDREVEKSEFITRLEVVLKENLNYYHNYHYL